MKTLVRMGLNMTWGVLKRVFVGFSQEIIADKIGEIICFNQGRYIHYNYMAGELHKELRETMGSNLPTDDYRKKVNQAKEKLEDHLHKGLEEMIFENFKMFSRVFRDYKSIILDEDPRMCLKVHFCEDDDEQVITTLFPDTKEKYHATSCKVDDNSASQHVQGSGEYYICNDIPPLACNRKYKNPRLHIPSLEMYSPPSWISPRRWGRDREWEKCWNRPVAKNGDILDNSLKSCYKSTLVIPVTLRGNRLGRPFDALFSKLREKGKDSLFVSEQYDDVEEIERHVYGYICFDHYRSGYFNEKFDKRVGYIFADIVSMFLFTFLTYTKLSRTYMRLES